MVNVLWLKLAREFWQRRLAMLSLAAILASGVGLFCGFLSTYFDLDQARGRFYQQCHLADFSLRCKRAPDWAVREALKVPGVMDAQGRINLPVRVELPGSPEPLTGTVLSVRLPHSFPSQVLSDVLLARGMDLTGRDPREILVNDSFARAREIGPGSRLRAVIQGGSYDFLVVGTVMSPEYIYDLPPSGGIAPDPARSPVLFVEQRFVQQAAALDGAYNEILGSVIEPTNRQGLRRILGAVENRLTPYGVLLSIPQDEQPSVNFLANELTELRVNSVWLPSICLGVVALVLHVVLARTVASQRTILGTLRALGYSKGFLRRHYLSYGLLLGCLGGVVGLGLGLWLQKAMLGLYRRYFEMPHIEPHLQPKILLLGVGLGLAFSLAGAWGGTRTAVHLEPAEAMRPAAPESVQPVWLERIPWLWQQLAFQPRMMARAILRNPFRSLVTVAASLLSTALIVETLCMLSSVEYLVDYEFRRTAHQDISVGLREAVDHQKAQREVMDLGAVAGSETQLLVTCDLSNGVYSKRVGVSGLWPGQRLFTPLDERGQSLQIPAKGLLLSRKLAEILHVSLGDTVRLRALLGRREEKQVPVMGIVDTYLGLSAYTGLNYLSQLIGEEAVANRILISTYHGPPGALLLERLRQRPLILGVEQRQQALAKIHETLDRSLGTSLTILVLFSGLLAFGSILNTSLVSLGERQREVGTLRVLGYSAKEVFVIFAGESFLLNLLGVGLGLMGGIGFAHLVSTAYNTELFRLPVVISFSLLGTASLLMVFFISAAQWVVYRLVASLPWLDVFKVRE